MARLLPLLFFLLTLGCTRGDGVLKDDPRVTDDDEPFSAINAVQNVGRLIVEVRQGDSYEVKVSAEQNMQAAVSTRVLNETLYISTTQDMSMSPSLPITVTVTMPSLINLRTSRLTQLSIQGLEGARLEASITGDTIAVLKGALKDLDMVAKGAPRIDAAELESERVTLRVTGKAIVDVNPRKRLELSATEALVRYIDKPDKIEKSLRKKARLERLDFTALKAERERKDSQASLTRKPAPKKGDPKKKVEPKKKGGDAIDRALGF